MIEYQLTRRCAALFIKTFLAVDTCTDCVWSDHIFCSQGYLWEWCIYTVHRSSQHKSFTLCWKPTTHSLKVCLKSHWKSSRQNPYWDARNAPKQILYVIVGHLKATVSIFVGKGGTAMQTNKHSNRWGVAHTRATCPSQLMHDHFSLV